MTHKRKLSEWHSYLTRSEIRVRESKLTDFTVLVAEYVRISGKVKETQTRFGDLSLKLNNFKGALILNSHLNGHHKVMDASLQDTLSYNCYVRRIVKPYKLPGAAFFYIDKKCVSPLDITESIMKYEEADISKFFREWGQLKRHLTNYLHMRGMYRNKIDTIFKHLPKLAIKDVQSGAIICRDKVDIIHQDDLILSSELENYLKVTVAKEYKNRIICSWGSTSIRKLTEKQKAAKGVA